MHPGVSVVILSYNRAHLLPTVLDRVLALPVDEIFVVDNGSSDGSQDIAREYHERVRLIEADHNMGAAGRNLAVEAARNELVIHLDDDSYPLPGAVEALAALFEQQPRLGVAGGLVRDVDVDGNTLRETELGTFDWFLRANHRGDPPPEGWPTFFFPECGCMVRRSAFLEVGGFYAPYFFMTSEVDVSTRMLKAGWDVRYAPAAVFEHLKDPGGRMSSPRVLRLRIRNQIWYSWLRMPTAVAVRRIAGYLLFDLVEATYRGMPGAWFGAVADAWRQRDTIRNDRDPVPRDLLARIECGRGRLHVRLLLGQIVKKGSAVVRRDGPRTAVA